MLSGLTLGEPEEGGGGGEMRISSDYYTSEARLLLNTNKVMPLSGLELFFFASYFKR